MSSIEARAEYNRLLKLSAESLDLTPTQYADAVEKYESVGKWLAQEGTCLADFLPDVFPQGSIALGTCVRPIGRDEFDIDLVCELQLPSNISQEAAKNLVGRRLRESSVYRKRLDEKNRCWRINYAGQFHLDVLPGKPDDSRLSPSAIVVPDKELECWKPSDPKGYTTWFAEEKARSLFEQTQGMQLEARAGVEPAPAQDTPIEKAPLQVAVQVLKRHRDVYFEGRDDAPISILLTTLAGQAYQGQGDILSTMEHLVATMSSHIEYEGEVAYVRNPTNRDENFAEKWQTHPDRKRAYYEWNEQAKQDIEDLKSTTLPKLEAVLKRFVGSKQATGVLRAHGESMERARRDSLRIDPATGILGATSAASIPVKKNTFFGDGQ